MFRESDTLVTYIWMYGSKRERPCPMCTAFLGSLDGEARDIMQRLPLAIIGRSPIERQKAFKKERGWRRLNFYADDSGAFARDYRGVGEDDEDWAAFNVFKREKDGMIRLFWADEMTGETAEEETEVVYVTYPTWMDAQRKSKHAHLLDIYHPIEGGGVPDIRPR